MKSRSSFWTGAPASGKWGQVLNFDILLGNVKIQDLTPFVTPFDSGDPLTAAANREGVRRARELPGS